MTAIFPSLTFAGTKERMQEIANELAKETLRGELSAHWWLPLDEISYISDFGAMEDMLNGHSLEDGSPRRA